MTASNPVVVVTRHRVAADQKDTFVISANSMLSMAARSRGYLGGDLVRPSSDNSVWQIVCRFDSTDAAHDWQAEASHSIWAGVLERCAQHVDGQRSPDRQDTERPTAAAPRTRPSKPAKPSPPSRWKMAVITLLALFPAVLGTNLIVVSQLTSLSLIPRTFVLCVIVTALMTWLLMPRLMKLFGPWLRDDQVRAEPARASAEPEPREVPSDDTIPFAIPQLSPEPPSPEPSASGPPSPEPPATGRSRHRAPSQRGHRQPPKAARSPGRQVPTRRR